MGKIRHHQTITSRTDFFYYAFRNILLFALPLTLIFALVLSLPHSSATTSSSDHVYFTLSTSCTMSGELISPHTVEIHGGQYKTNVGTTKLNTYCNDSNGYSIYAIGSSNNIDGSTDLINSDNNNYNISTGIYDSGTATPNTPSSWSMKLTSGTGTGNTLTPPTIVNGYDDYSEVPSAYTRVASRTSETEMNTDTDVTGSYLTTTYAIYTSSFQPAGSYSGNVKYVMIHPNSNADNITGSFNTAFFKAGKSPAYQDGSGNYYFAMQDMTSDICTSVSGDGEATATQLVDIRDNKLYWVTKLKDEHCWMTQNLDTDISPSISFNSTNTDLNVIYNNSQYAEYNDNYTEIGGIIYWNPVSSANTVDFTSTPINGWESNSARPYSANKTNDSGTGHTSLGNYYNWTAAIASNNSSSLTNSTYSNVSQNPKNSICPKGWRLPTISSESPTANNSTNEFMKLKAIYTTISEEPLYFFKAGFIDSANSINNNYALYWSSTISGTNEAYTLQNINNAGNSRAYGLTIRCIAK